MERLSGLDLAAVIKASGCLPSPVAVDYALQVCAGLAAAHAIGLVHLDIKPANLFLVAGAAGSGVIKILDFGISQWLDNTGEHTVSEVGGGPLCSRSYSSPEQLEGAGSLDQRSDVWSLGAVMFEMLTGECPLLRPAISEVWSGILSPIPSVRHLQPSVDQRLATIVEVCLETKRSSRYSSIEALALALAPFASVNAFPSTGRSRLGPRVQAPREAREPASGVTESNLGRTHGRAVWAPRRARVEPGTGSAAWSTRSTQRG
jgi:serine/threonine-protein kinase